GAWPACHSEAGRRRGPCLDCRLNAGPAVNRTRAGMACALLFLSCGQTSSRPLGRQEETMRLDTRFTRGIQLALAGTLAAASLASPAAADHWRRYKHDPRFAHFVYAPVRERVYISRSSCGSPALAGFVGGLVIGSAIAHAASPPP